MNYGYTVNDLDRFVKKQLAKGNGDKYIRISSDDEGNSFHSLLFGFTDDKESLENYIKSGMMDDDLPSDKVVVLG